MDGLTDISLGVQSYLSQTNRIENASPSAESQTDKQDARVAADEKAANGTIESGAAKESKEAVESREAKENAMAAAYGNVLDISEDGDTVTARPEALAALEDGIVMLKTDAASPIQTNGIDEAEDDEEASKDVQTNQSQSLVGISESQVETMYRQGKISGADYRSELERRERLEEQLNPEEDDDTAVSRNNEFVQTMSNIDAAARAGAIENAGLDEAEKNGRTDIMLDIFNPAN